MPNLFSIWKIANAFGMKMSEFIEKVENELGDILVKIPPSEFCLAVCESVKLEHYG